GTTRNDAASRARFGEFGFRIFDTTSFACLIARCIPGFTFGVEGHCRYQETRYIQRALSPKAITSSGGIDPFLAMDEAAGLDPYFLKEQRHEEQAEYRFIWSVNQTTGPTIDIVCPKARDYCEPVG